MEPSPLATALVDAASNGAAEAVRQFDQAVADLTDLLLASCHKGRKSLQGAVRERCSRMVDEQLASFREQAGNREQRTLARWEERNDSVRRVLEVKERHHREAVDALSARLKARRSAQLRPISALVAKAEAWRIESGAEVVFLLWRAAAIGRRFATTGDLADLSQCQHKTLDRPMLMKAYQYGYASQENEPPRNGFGWCPPQVPPPAYPPRDRPALRSVCSDGSVTPAGHGGAPAVAHEVSMPLLQATFSHHSQSVSPPAACRVEAARAYQFGECGGQRSASSLPTCPVVGLGSGYGDAAWGSSCRAPSGGPRQPPSRGPSPPPSCNGGGGSACRPPSLQSPGVPLPPQHMMQAPWVRPMLTTGSLGGLSNGSGPPLVGSGGRQTPRSSPPSRAVASSAPPGAPPGAPPLSAVAWASSAAPPGAPGMAGASPRNRSPHVEPSMFFPAPLQPSGSFVPAPLQPSGSFVAVAAPASPCHQAAAAAAAGACYADAMGGQCTPNGQAHLGAFARLRQGSPLSRSRPGIGMGLGPPPMQAPGPPFPRPCLARQPMV